MGSAVYSTNKQTGEVFVEHAAESLILVTEDRMRVRLMESLEQLHDRSAWIAPASLLPTIAAALVASTFQNALHIEASTWAAMFWMGGAATVVWLVITLVRLRKPKATVETIIANLKADTATAKPKDQSSGYIVTTGRV